MVDIGPGSLLGGAMAGVAAGALAAAARAATPADIVIGAVYPLSGSSAPIGHDAQIALQLEADIINGHCDLPMLLGRGGGLPALGGAKIKLVFADRQNSPQIARTEAERLITEERVVAVVGGYASATAVTISQICNRYEIPYISAESSAPSLSRPGLTWLFRPSPTDVGFTQSMFDFFAGNGKATGRPVHSFAIIHEDSGFGTSSPQTQESMAKEAGIKVLADISYPASSPSLSVGAEPLRAANAGVVMPSFYASDATLPVRSMHDAAYAPKAILAQDARFIDPAFFSAVGPLAEAINRAGSTKNTALQAALKAADIPGSQTIMPWVGIKFGATGKNTEGSPVIQQCQHEVWHTILPFDVATAPGVWNIGK